MKVLIRADGDSAMGTGHVMRMLALAQWLTQDDGQVEHAAQVIFASARLSPQLETRLRAQGYAVERAELTEGSAEDSAWTCGLVAAHACDWLVCDGYHFADAFQAAIHRAGILQLVIDDYGHCQQQIAELVVNQNASASEAFYPRRAAHTELLLGTQYVLLRREFVAAARGVAERKVAERADRILVTLGGADPSNATALIAASLRAIPDPELRVRVVIGPSNPRVEELRRELRDERFELIAGANDMAALMAATDLAIAGAGTTTWELAYMGVPTLLVVLADNQEALAAAMADAGACINLGWHHALREVTTTAIVQALRADAPRRRQLGALGHAKVDGQGGRRILEAMRRRLGSAAARGERP